MGNLLTEHREQILTAIFDEMGDFSSSYDSIIDGLEKMALTKVLSATDNCKARAAKIMGMHRTTFIMKMRKHKMKLNTPFRKGVKRAAKRK